jgi:hypothetical protein
MPCIIEAVPHFGNIRGGTPLIDAQWDLGLSLATTVVCGHDLIGTSGSWNTALACEAASHTKLAAERSAVVSRPS